MILVFFLAVLLVFCAVGGTVEWVLLRRDNRRRSRECVRRIRWYGNRRAS